MMQTFPRAPQMRYEYTLWAVVMATALHVLEEYGLNFRAWAEVALGIRILWEEFHLVNGAVILFFVGCAMTGWRLPEVSLMAPALVGVNGLFFHLGLSLVQWRYSPGTATSVLLFIPVALWAYWGAHRDGVLTRRAVVVSLAGGTLVMCYPLVLLWVRNYYNF
jgi:hypothetical protein